MLQDIALATVIIVSSIAFVMFWRDQIDSYVPHYRPPADRKHVD